MINQIDRYIAALFGKVFFVCFISVAGIYIIGDFVNNVTELVGSGGESLIKSLAYYYSARLPWFFDISSRVITVVAGVFVVAWLHRHNELTALMAAGISRLRIVTPLILATCAVSILAAANREFGIPAVRTKLCQDVDDQTNEDGQKLIPVYDNETRILLGGKRLFPRQRRIEEPEFQLPTSLHGFAQSLAAAEAFYRPRTDEIPAGYLLRGVKQPKDLSRTRSRTINNRPIVLTSFEVTGLKADECFVISNVSFEQLQSGHRWHRYCSTFELISGLRYHPLLFGSNSRLLVHARVVQPVLDVLLLFLGLPVIMSPQRRVFVSVGLCVLIMAVYTTVVICSHALGIHDLISTPLAAWIPLLLFVPVAVFQSNAFFR